MRVASVVLFASVAVLVAAASKIESSVADERGSSDQTPREARLNLNQADSRSDQSLQPPASDTDGEVSAATFLQPQFVVPNNGDPVGLRVKQCCQPSSIGSSSGSSDGDPTQVAEPPAAARADSYGLLLSGPELTERETDVTQSPVSPLLPPVAQRRSNSPPLFPALTSAGPSGGQNTRGRLLSLIDGAYQQSLDTNASTTFITPLDRLGREPFEVSVGRYSRFVEGEAKRRGQTHAEEDLEDLMQRLKGRLKLDEPDEGQDEEQSEGSDRNAANGSIEVRTAGPVVDPGTGEHIAVGRAVDPGLTEQSILFDTQTGGRTADVRLPNEQAGQLHDTKDENLNIKSLPFAKTNANVLQDSPHRAVFESVYSDHFSFSDNKLSCQDGCEPPPNKASEPRNSDQENAQDFFGNKAENGKPRIRLNDVAELTDILQPLSDSDFDSDSESGSDFDSDSDFYTEPEARDAPAVSLSSSDHTDRYVDSVGTFLLDIADGEKQSKPDSSPSSIGDEKPRRLLEYKTHAEISVRGGHEAPGPEAEGYGPAKPSSLIKPNGDSESKDEASSKENGADNEAKRGVTQRNFDVEVIPPSSSKSSRERPQPRLIEQWEPPKQQPRIKIHLPFVQKETIIQFHPRDRKKYGPPKGFHSTSSKLQNHRGHPPRQRGASGTTERPLSAGLRPPGRAPGDGRIAADSPLPSHLLPKEHRVTGQSHGQPQLLQQDDRQRPGTGNQPPKHSGYEAEYQPSAQQKPEIGYHPAVQENPQTEYSPIPQSPDVDYHPPVSASPAAEYHQPAQPEPDTYTGYQPPVPLHPQQNNGVPVHLAPPALRGQLAYQRPPSVHRRPSLRPAWLDVPREVLPLAEPPGTSAELPYDPTTELSFHSLRLSTPAPAYIPPEPIYTPPTQEYDGASAGNGGGSLSSYSQVEPSPTPHGSTHSSPVRHYVTPIFVKLSSTTPSSYVSLESTPSYASPKSTPSYAPPEPIPSYAPKKLSPSYTPPKPNPLYAPPSPTSSHSPPKPTLLNALQKPNPLYAPPKPNPSYASPSSTPLYSPPKPTPSYAPQNPNPLFTEPKPTPSYAPPKPSPSYTPPKPTPSYSAPAHPAPEPALARLPYTEVNHDLSGYPAPKPSPVILPLAPIRNYAVPSVDRLAERPLLRVPADSHVQGFVKPPSDDLPHRPSPPEVHSPQPSQVQHVIRNYVSQPEDKLAQKTHAPVAHTSHPASVGQPVRNYVTPPEYKLVQTPQVSVVHASYPVSARQPVRNYVAASEDRPAQKPHLVFPLPSHQAPAGHTTRNYPPPAQRTARDGADHRTVQQDTTDPQIAVEPLQRSADDHSADGARQGQPGRPVESEQQRTAGDDHSHQQQQQDHNSAQQLHKDHISHQQLPQDHSSHEQLLQDHSSPQQLPQDNTSHQQLPQGHSSPQQLPQDNISHQKLPQDHSSRQQLSQDNISHQQLPQDHSSRQQLPQDHSSHKQLLQDHSSPQQLPQDNTSHQQLPQGHSSPQQLPQDNSSHQQLPQDHSSRQQLSQDNISHQQLPQDHSSRQQLSQDNISHQQLPQDHSSRQQLPQDNISHQQLPQDHSSRQQLPQDHSSRQQLPQDHSSRQQLPQDNISRQQLPQDHSSHQQLPQDHSSRQQLPQDHGSHQELPREHSSPQKLLQDNNSPQQLSQDHSSPQQLPQDIISHQQLPQDHSSPQQLPQDIISHQQLPQDHSSHQQLPQDKISHQQLPQDHGIRQQLPQAISTDSHPPRKPQKETSIVDVLEAAGSKLLLKLMELSGFRQLLEDTGPYTLFAPSEQSLQDLLLRLGGLDTILDSMGKESLLQLLQYHVLRGYALLEDLDHDLLAKTLEGSRLRVNRYDTYDNSHGRANVTTVNGERLVRADLAADNGLVHFIDGVLAPPPADLMLALQRDPRGRFTVLTEALRLAGLQTVLTDRTGGPLTLLAPTNVAFTQLPADQLRRLLRDRRRLRQLLLGHVIGGTLYSAGLQPFQEEATLAGTTVGVFSNTVSMKVDNALVLVPDVSAGNGVVHAIDAVLGLQEER